MRPYTIRILKMELRDRVGILTRFWDARNAFVVGALFVLAIVCVAVAESKINREWFMRVLGREEISVLGVATKLRYVPLGVGKNISIDDPSPKKQVMAETSFCGDFCLDRFTQVNTKDLCLWNHLGVGVRALFRSYRSKLESANVSPELLFRRLSRKSLEFKVMRGLLGSRVPVVVESLFEFPIMRISWGGVHSEPIDMISRDEGSLDRFQGLAIDLVGRQGRSPLVTGYYRVRNDSQHGGHFHEYLEEFPAAFLGVVGYFMCFYGIWNLKLGPQDWRGFLALALGIASFVYGFRLFLDADAQNVKSICQHTQFVKNFVGDRYKLVDIIHFLTPGEIA
jgi:hypothetical protein